MAMQTPLQFSLFRRLVIAVTLGWLALFVLNPHLLVLVSSILTSDPQHLVAWPLTLEHFIRLFDPIYSAIFWHSLWLAGIATLLTLLIGYPFALVLSRLSPAWRGALLFLMIVPFWTNSLIRTYAIKALLGKQGLFNTLLLSSGLIEQPLQLIYTPFAVVFGLVYILLPFMVLPLLANLSKLDGALLEAGRDLGAGVWQRFGRITLPLTLPGVVAGSLLVFLPALGMFYVADLLGGAKGLLLGNLIKEQFLLTRNWPFGAAASIAIMLLMALLLWLYWRVNRYVQRQGGLDDQNL